MLDTAVCRLGCCSGDQLHDSDLQVRETTLITFINLGWDVVTTTLKSQRQDQPRGVNITSLTLYLSLNND
jgi:hypothetical protein